jgi:hypothetical protein
MALSLSVLLALVTLAVLALLSALDMLLTLLTAAVIVPMPTLLLAFARVGLGLALLVGVLLPVRLVLVVLVGIMGHGASPCAGRTLGALGLRSGVGRERLTSPLAPTACEREAQGSAYA